MDSSNIAKRMKDYESISKSKLMKRCPVCIRIDGKAHHGFTKGFIRPFDDIYTRSMQKTAKYLCENIQGVVLSYQQSDEITLIMIDYEELNITPYFDYEVQKLCSIAASMATMAFNKFFEKEIQDFHYHIKIDPVTEELDTEQAKQFTVYKQALNRGAMFDARCFNIPKEEVTNLIYWRQLDATRNSIQMVGQANFSHKELQNKSCNKIQDMLMTQRGINWNDFPVYQKRGSCCIKSEVTTTYAKVGEDGAVFTGSTERPHWIIDNNIPIFKNEDRAYIDKLIFIDGNELSKPIILN